MAEKLERIQRSFLWTGVEERKRLALVNWDTVYHPKSQGGLGIRKITNLNKALITKVGWNLMLGEAEWCTIMKAKYLNQEHFSRALDLMGLPSGSKIWNNILKCRSLLKEGIKWKIGNGRSIRF